jgi:hypothetical protein
MPEAKSFIVAALASALAGALIFDPPRYTYWRLTAPKWFSAFFVVYLAVYGAAGALGAVIGHALGLEIHHVGWVFNALLFALIGQTVLRVEPQGFALEHMEVGRSILATSVRRVVGWMDLRAERAVELKLQTLSDLHLFDQALYLHGKYVALDPASVATAETQRKKIIDWGASLLGSEHARARGTLERWCFQEIARRRLAPDVAWCPAR